MAAKDIPDIHGFDPNAVYAYIENTVCAVRGTSVSEVCCASPSKIRTSNVIASLTAEMAETRARYIPFFGAALDMSREEFAVAFYYAGFRYYYNSPVPSVQAAQELTDYSENCDVFETEIEHEIEINRILDAYDLPRVSFCLNS